jgi:uncharacterized protein YbaR (Trm112 family)
MRLRVLEFLCCPACKRGELGLSVFHEEGDHVIDGALRCDLCGRVYLVVGGVPRMLPPDLYSNPDFTEKYRDRLTLIGGKGPADFISQFKQLKRDTSQAYGFEWTHWNRYGWVPQGGPSDLERATFHYKSLLSPEELRGKAVLDGGCGNGRYAHTAAEYAKDLIALDLSAAVESAFQNTRHQPAAHVVQGDIMNPPVKRGVLDAVFSIGVLMITGDTRRATESLAELLKPGGTITVHLYAAGFPLWQLNDTLVRALTTRLTVPQNVALAKGMAKVARWLDKRHWLGYASLILRVWPDDVINYDWYATPKQTYHTYPEVEGWFREMGYDVVATNERQPARTLRERVGRIVWYEAMMTVRGRKPYAAAATKRAAR